MNICDKRLCTTPSQIVDTGVLQNVDKQALMYMYVFSSIDDGIIFTHSFVPTELHKTKWFDIMSIVFLSRLDTQMFAVSLSQGP